MALVTSGSAPPGTFERSAIRTAIAERLLERVEGLASELGDALHAKRLVAESDRQVHRSSQHVHLAMFVSECQERGAGIGREVLGEERAFHPKRSVELGIAGRDERFLATLDRWTQARVAERLMELERDLELML